MLNNNRLIPFIVSLAMFIESMDSTILNTAIPTLAYAFHINPINLKIALISYLLSLAIFIPISGWVADRFGIKRTFIIAMSIFTVSSFCCGLATQLWELVAARLIQGFGSALCLPVGRLIIVRLFERKLYMVIMSRVVMYGVIGTLLGPTLGGFIVHHFAWHWIFWINVPIGILAILITQRFLPCIPSLATHPLDVTGFIAFGISLSALTLGSAFLSESSIPFAWSWLTLLIAAAFLILYVVHSRQQPHPILNTKVIKTRTFQIAALGNLCSRISFGGAPFLIPLLLQLGLGYSAQTAGLLLAPLALGVLCVKPVSVKILRYFGYKKFLIANSILTGLGLCGWFFVSATSSFLFISSLTFLYGLFISLQYTAVNSLGYADLAATELSNATSIVSTLQQLGQSLGISIAALCLRAISQVLSTSHAISIAVFHYTFLIVGGLTILTSTLFFVLRNNDGAAVLQK